MSIKRITSRENAWFKRFRRAAERHDEEIVLEGPKQIADALAAGIVPLAIAATDESMLDFAARESTQLILPGELLRSISGTTTPQGILALCARPAATLRDLPATASRILVLDRIQDPGNAGTLIRLAAAFRCDAVLLTTGSADPFGPKSLRAAASTSFLLPLVRCSGEEVVTFVSERDIQLVAADGNATADVRGAELPTRIALVVGSEGEGVSELFTRRAQLFRIATDPRVESLNVATAAAIFLWSVDNGREQA